MTVSRLLRRLQPRPRLAFSAPLAEALSQSGLHVVITGAGGWIGQAMLEMVESALGDDFANRVHAFGSTRRRLQMRSGRAVFSERLEDLRSLDATPHVLAHLAFVTREQVALQPNTYWSLNETISSAVLDHVQRGHTEGLFIPSSGAVYNANGDLETDRVANPYGWLKLRDEDRFGDACRWPDRTAIARVFNLAGPFLNKAHLYALGSIITDLGNGGPIDLRADHFVIRSYVHVADLVEVAFAVMLGEIVGPRAPFDTAAAREIEIGELATLTAALVGLPETRIERPQFTDCATPDRYVGDGTQMRKLAEDGGRELAPLEAQILDTAEFLWSVQQPRLPDLPGG